MLSQKKQWQYPNQKIKNFISFKKYLVDLDIFIFYIMNSFPLSYPMYSPNKLIIEIFHVSQSMKRSQYFENNHCRFKLWKRPLKFSVTSIKEFETYSDNYDMSITTYIYYSTCDESNVFLSETEPLVEYWCGLNH